jgi:tight adherence protein C
MIPMLIVSAVVGLGLVRLQRLAFPAAPPLVDQAARWERARARAGRRALLDVAPEDQTWSKRAAEWFAENLRTRRPDDMRTYERDLAITGQPMEEWLSRLLVWFLVGLLGPIALILVANAIGLGIPMLAAPPLGILGAVIALIGEVKELREKATQRREELCDALSDFLDLVVMAMEGGRSHADALPDIAEIGGGWAFHTFYDAIDNARPNGMTPWQALGEVGDRYGVVELLDLRAALNLAQDQGSSIRNTLIERAKSMRDARLNEAQERANKSTDAMRNNLMVMALVAAAYVILARVLFLFTA